MKYVLVFKDGDAGDVNLAPERLKEGILTTIRMDGRAFEFHSASLRYGAFFYQEVVDASNDTA